MEFCSHFLPRNEKTQTNSFLGTIQIFGCLINTLTYLINTQLKRLKNVKQSAISDHLLTCDCNINFNDFTIFSKDSNNINLLIKDSLLTSRDKPILNETAKSFPLELFE